LLLGIDLQSLRASCKNDDLLPAVDFLSARLVEGRPKAPYSDGLGGGSQYRQQQSRGKLYFLSALLRCNWQSPIEK